MTPEQRAATELPTAPLPDGVARAFDAARRAALVELRRELHAHPELSGAEHRTAVRLERALREIAGAEGRRVATTGLVARIPGRDPQAPVVAIRGDIDALPIGEATGLPFTSAASGVMHACGHDIHASWTVGAAALLRERPAQGDVLVVLQPAEETGQGARAILATGIVDGVAAIFGGHVDTRFPVGDVVAQPGAIAASTDTFTIELVGEGAHGARPHEAADPIVAAASLVSALQTIVSRRLDPSLAAVVTVGTIHAGTASNIIPDRATLSGTLRATTPASRRLLVDEVTHLAGAVAAAHRVQARVSIEAGTPPVVNEAAAAAWAHEGAARLLGAEHVVPLGTTNMGGEDFAFYLERMPGCFLRIGACAPGSVRTAAHAPNFSPAEEALFVGAAVLAETARVASEALAR
ncbi:MAG TPA: M20 family metallopeptidase [Gemmatimonadaceae bacterium]